MLSLLSCVIRDTILYILIYMSFKRKVSSKVDVSLPRFMQGLGYKNRLCEVVYVVFIDKGQGN